MFGPIASTVAAGVAADKVSKALPGHEDEQLHHLKEHTDSLAMVCNLLEEIKDALDVVTGKSEEDDHNEIMVLTPGIEETINDRGLRYTAVYAGTTGIVLTVKVPGVGAVTYPLTLGWNPLNLPQGTFISSASTCSLNFRASNNPITASQQATAPMTQAVNAAWTKVYSTTQTGVSTWAGSGPITNLSQYSQIYINFFVSAITGTSIQFTVSRPDSNSNAINIAFGATLNAPGSDKMSIGAGMAVNQFFGNTINIGATLTAITSVTFNLEVWAR